MSTGRELQKQQEESLFDNVYAQQYVRAGKTKKLQAHLGAQEKRLQSGMTAEEIEAVTKRAKEAFKLQEESEE